MNNNSVNSDKLNAMNSMNNNGENSDMLNIRLAHPTFASKQNKADARKTNTTGRIKPNRTKRTSNKPLKESALLFNDIEIHILYMRRKSMSLNVKSPDGRVELRVPALTSCAAIEHFLQEKHDWLVRTRKSVLKSPMSRAYYATPEEQKEWLALVQACVPALIAKWEPVLNVKHEKLAYRNMTSRWGSCNTKTGRICINIRLALYPSECLEYVVVHELCHLRVSGHGAEFWQLVGTCLPNYKQPRAKLR